MSNAEPRYAQVIDTDDRSALIRDRATGGVILVIASREHQRAVLASLNLAEGLVDRLELAEVATIT